MKRSSAGRPRPLVIGGAGFVGTSLCARLAEDGENVLILDDLSRRGSETNLTWLQQRFGSRVELIRADVRDRAAVAAAVARASFVFDFAAQVAVTTSLADPRTDFEVNAMGVLNVLEALRRLPAPPPLLFTSTNKVYGCLEDVELRRTATRYEPSDPELRDRGIGEDHALDLRTPYGCSKGAADQYVLDYARSFGLRTAVLRMSCIFGPHQNGTADQGWVAHLTASVLQDRELQLFGDGLQVRDLLFSADLVEALLCASRHIDAISGRALNVGGGPANSCSLVELIDRLQRSEGRPVKVRVHPWRSDDQRWYVSDTTALRDATGWRPRVGLDEGLERLTEWLRDRLGEGAPPGRGRADRSLTRSEP